MTTTAAPCFRNNVACSMNSFSPTLSEIEFTIALPWFHFRPASTMSNLELSIMNGRAHVRLRTATARGRPSAPRAAWAPASTRRGDGGLGHSAATRCRVRHAIGGALPGSPAPPFESSHRATGGAGAARRCAPEGGGARAPWSLAMSISSGYLPSMMSRLNLREPGDVAPLAHVHEGQALVVVRVRTDLEVLQAGQPHLRRAQNRQRPRRRSPCRPRRSP